MSNPFPIIDVKLVDTRVQNRANACLIGTMAVIATLYADAGRVFSHGATGHQHKNIPYVSLGGKEVP